jgi:hypothetical protein
MAAMQTPNTRAQLFEDHHQRAWRVARIDAANPKTTMDGEADAWWAAVVAAAEIRRAAQLAAGDDPDANID